MFRTGAGATRAFRDPNQNQDVKGKCQMNKRKAGIVFIALLTCALAGQALAQGSKIEFKSNAADLTKIRSVVEEFRQDIIHKDAYALTKLMLNSNVLFHHINNQEEVDSARKSNAQFDGIGPSQLDGFAKFLSTSKDKLEEKFHNIEIRQDGDLGLVTLNYDFVLNDKVTNSGVEVWQLCKIDGQWKILSVTWTRYDHS
jgi:ketosteroid isomerase-like protein